MNCPNAPLCACSPILFLLISAIVLPIATIIDAVFALKSRGFAGVEDYFNVFNNEFNLEKSDLINNEYGPLWPQTQTHTQTGHPSGAGLREFNDLGYVFDVILNENEFCCGVNNIFNNEINNECGLSNGLFFEKSGVSDFRIRGCDIIGCIFGGILCENEFYY